MSDQAKKLLEKVEAMIQEESWSHELGGCPRMAIFRNLCVRLKF